MAVLEPMLMLIFSGDGDAGWASGSDMEAEEGSVQEETTKVVLSGGKEEGMV